MGGGFELAIVMIHCIHVKNCQRINKINKNTKRGIFSGGGK